MAENTPAFMKTLHLINQGSDCVISRWMTQVLTGRICVFIRTESGQRLLGLSDNQRN